MHASGPECSSVIWGSMRCESQFATPGDLAEHLRWLLDRDITTLDTANVYGEPDPYTVEAFLGEAVAEVGRDRFEIVTKCGIQRVSRHREVNRVRHFDFSAAEIRRSTERSLRKLRIEVIDLLLLHRPDFLMDPDETAAELDALVAEGKVRHVGVSNFSPSQVALLASRLKAPIVTNQVEFSPLHLRPLGDGTFDAAIAAGYRPMIWSPVGGGRLLASDEAPVVELRAKLAAVAEAYGLDGPADAAFAFVVRHPARGIPLVGSGRRERVAGALKAANTVLDRQDWYDIMSVTMPSLAF